MNKKILLILAIFAMLLISSSVLAKTEVEFIHWRVEDLETFEEINRLFEEENPDIDIIMDAIPTSNYPNTLVARLGAADIDIVGVNPFGQVINQQPGILEGEMLYDLTGQKFLKNYSPSTLGNNVTYDEKIFAVPTTLNNLLVYYNKDLFKELKIESPKTYSEFINICEIIKKEGTIPLAFGGRDTWPIRLYPIAIEPTVIRAEDPDFFPNLDTGETKLTDPKFVEVLRKVKELSTYWEPNALGVGYGNSPTLFTQQKTAMFLDASWTIGQIIDAEPNFEVGVFIFPGSDKYSPKNYVPVKYGLNLAIADSSEVKEEALKYLEFVSRPDIYKKYINGVKQLPTQPDISFEDNALLNEISGLLGNNLEFCFQVLPAGIKIQDNPIYQKVTLDMLTPEEAAAELQKQVDNSLK